MRIEKRKKEIEEETYICEICGKEYANDYHFVKCEKCGEMICDSCAQNIHMIDDMPLRTYFDDVGNISVTCDIAYANDNYLDVYVYALCKKCAEARSDEIRKEYNKSIEEAVNEFNRKIKKANEKYLKG